jgi:hypothetical protein
MAWVSPRIARVAAASDSLGACPPLAACKTRPAYLAQLCDSTASEHGSRVTIDRLPLVSSTSIEDVLSGFAPTRRFAYVSFDNY